jgi:hypothetical protein
MRIPVAALHALLLVGASLSPEAAMATEEPRYESLLQDGEFSLRLYAPRVVAETEVAGTLEEASSTGFRRIAGYIFGRNHSRSGQASERIAMTAPVTVEAQPQKIAMTAPVSVEQVEGRWRIEFVMPARYALATLPLPDDASVTLREVPAQKIAAIRFSGLVGAAKMRDQTARLRAWMAQGGLAATAAPQLARYNPPWTLPFLRRNEILIPCQ